jgi:hypothetical protein
MEQIGEGASSMKRPPVRSPCPSRDRSGDTGGAGWRCSRCAPGCRPAPALARRRRPAAGPCRRHRQHHSGPPSDAVSYRVTRLPRWRAAPVPSWCAPAGRFEAKMTIDLLCVPSAQS